MRLTAVVALGAAFVLAPPACDAQQPLAPEAVAVAISHRPTLGWPHFARSAAGKVVSVTVSPDSAKIEIGLDSALVTAVVKNQFATDVKQAVQWSVPTADTAKVTLANIADRSVTVVPRAVGTLWVYGKVGPLTDSTKITIIATALLTQVIVLPTQWDMASGTTKQFTATAKWSDGTTRAVSPTWSATGGTTSQAGLYTAGTTSGSYRIVATASGRADTSAITITAPPTAATMTALTLTPASASLQSGGSQGFTATGTWSDGIAHPFTPVWTATGGTIAVGGAYTATYTAGGTSGPYGVIASANAKADTAAIAITASSAACTGVVRTIPVATGGALVTALNAALPGDCILLSAGTYTMASYHQTRAGTASRPITVRGVGATSIVTMGGGSWLPEAAYLHFRNFRLTSTFYGFYCGESPRPGCPYAVFDSMEVDHAAQSGIALQNGSSFAQVLRSKVHDTGLSNAQYGEAVYVGGYGAATTDVEVRNNTLYLNGAECIDNSAGSDRMTATGNTCDGTGTAFIDQATVSLIGLRGNNLTVSNNTLTKGDPHGIIVWQGTGSVLQSNVIHLYDIHAYGGPIGIQVKPGASATVRCNNTVDNVPVGGTAFSPACVP